MIRRLVVLVAVTWPAASGAVAAALPGDQTIQHEEVRQVMGTLAAVRVWADNVPVGRAAVDTAFAVLVEVDSLMSTWNGNSPLSRLNRAPVDQWVPVGPDVCRVLAAAVELSRLTGGAFDPMVLPLVRLWRFQGGKATLPAAADLAAARALVDVGALAVEATRARLRRAGMAVDLGGIAKGYALDRAAAAMRSVGARGGVLDLGGNLLVFGVGAGREVAVVDPRHPGQLVLTVPLPAGAVATSGQYERFVTIEGRDYGHILDPRTGWPVPAGCSATVIASEALWADALATAVLVLGPEAGLALLERLPDVEGVVVVGGDILPTSGLMTTVPDQGP